MEVGSDSYFSYSVKGSPIPTIKWYKVNDDNQEEFLTFCDKGDGGCEAVNGNYPTYVIERFSFDLYSASYPRDNGVFKCVIKNIEGNLSKSFRLTVTGTVISK